jgi:hypothetical protein
VIDRVLNRLIQCKHVGWGEYRIGRLRDRHAIEADQATEDKSDNAQSKH